MFGDFGGGGLEGPGVPGGPRDPAVCWHNAWWTSCITREDEIKSVLIT